MFFPRDASRRPSFVYNRRMILEDFEKIAEEGFERLPEWVRLKIKNVALLIEDEPSEEDRALNNVQEDETLLGLYKGVPLNERGAHYGEGFVMPDTITLYRLPILEAAKEDKLDVRDVVADTIWHEFAHHFGIDEDGVRTLEEARGIGDFRQGS
jgi:predicted Zn-dependent protease with MMP-like domain